MHLPLNPKSFLEPLTRKTIYRSYFQNCKWFFFMLHLSIRLGNGLSFGVQTQELGAEVASLDAGELASAVDVGTTTEVIHDAVVTVLYGSGLNSGYKISAEIA